MIKMLFQKDHITLHWRNRCLAFFPFSFKMRRYGPKEIKKIKGWLFQGWAFGPFRFLRAKWRGGWKEGPFGMRIPLSSNLWE